MTYNPINNPWVPYAMAETLRHMDTEVYLGFVRQKYSQTLGALGTDLFEKNRLAGIVYLLKHADKTQLYQQLQPYWNFPHMEDINSRFDWNDVIVRRQFLNSFNSDELKVMTISIPALRAVYEKFSSGMSKKEMVQLIIEACNRSTDAREWLLMVTALERPYWKATMPEPDISQIRLCLKQVSQDKDTLTRVNALINIYKRLWDTIPKAKPIGHNLEKMSVSEIIQALIEYAGPNNALDTLHQLAQAS